MRVKNGCYAGHMAASDGWHPGAGRITVWLRANPVLAASGTLPVAGAQAGTEIVRFLHRSRAGAARRDAAAGPGARPAARSTCGSARRTASGSGRWTADATRR